MALPSLDSGYEPPKKRFNAIFAMTHIGHAIKKELKDQGRSVTWFAKKLCCHRSNAYKIFERDNIDVKMLQRICDILEKNFFNEINKTD